MKVKEAYQVLYALMAGGHGDLDLIYQDCRSGDSGSVQIYADVDELEEPYDMGCLCEEEVGYKYVPVYCDH